MRLAILGIACMSIMLADSGFAASMRSYLPAEQAREISADQLSSPHQRQRQLDRYLHGLSIAELLAVVKSTTAEPALMEFALGDFADSQALPGTANAAERLKSPLMRRRLIQSLGSFLLNSASDVSVARLRTPDRVLKTGFHSKPY